MDTAKRFWVVFAAVLFIIVSASVSFSHCVRMLCHYGYLLVYTSFDGFNLVHFFQFIVLVLVMMSTFISFVCLTFICVRIFIWKQTVGVLKFLMVSKNNSPHS